MMLTKVTQEYADGTKRDSGVTYGGHVRFNCWGSPSTLTVEHSIWEEHAVFPWNIPFNGRLVIESRDHE